MRPSGHRATILVVTLAVAVLGVADAVFSDDWDLVAVFVLLVAVQLLSLAGLQRHRATVTVRRDLSAWLTERAAATGEPADRIADRCVAAYRAGLTEADP
jgi:hypothetical protein